MATKKKKAAAPKKKQDPRWHEQRIDIREHRDRLRELHGPRAGAMGWFLALLGMAAVLAILSNPF